MPVHDPWPRHVPLQAVLDALADEDDRPAAAHPAAPVPSRTSTSTSTATSTAAPVPMPMHAPEPEPPAPRRDALRPEIALPCWRGYDPKALSGPRPYPWCPTPAACRVLIRNLGDPDRVPCRCRRPDFRGL